MAKTMTKSSQRYRQEVLSELQAIPPEYLPFLLQMVRSFRESVALKPAAECFRQGWKEARRGETIPVKNLWEGIDAE